MENERLAILVPDGAYPEVLKRLLGKRRKSLGIRDIVYSIIKDMLHDSSPDAAPLLRPYLRSCTHALVLRDLHGSGAEKLGAVALEQQLSKELTSNGWREECVGVIVVEPEIEAWLRFDSAHLEEMVRTRARRPCDLGAQDFRAARDRAIAKTGGLAPTGKPANPKEALEEIFREFGIQRSNALYGILAEKESLRDCATDSFKRLVQLLQLWFPAES